MLKKAASLIKRFIRELKKIDNHMDSVIEYLLILFSNEPYWKREDFVQAQTVPIKDQKNNISIGVIANPKSAVASEKVCRDDSIEN